MNANQIPRPFADYQQAIVAFRTGRGAEASYHLIWVIDSLTTSLQHSRKPPSPSLARALQDLLKARERNDQTALADILQYDLPAAGLFETVPIHRLALRAEPDGSQRRGEPVELIIEAEQAAGVELEFIINAQYAGPEPLPPPHPENRQLVEYSTAKHRKWHTPRCAGICMLRVKARLKGGDGSVLMTDYLEYRLT